MRKIVATSSFNAIDEDRPQIYVSHGQGNVAGEIEVHLEIIDPASGNTVYGWFRRDDLLAAVLEPTLEATA